MRPKPFLSLFKSVSTVDESWSEATSRARPGQVRKLPRLPEALSELPEYHLRFFVVLKSENYKRIKYTNCRLIYNSASILLY